MPGVTERDEIHERQRAEYEVRRTQLMIGATATNSQEVREWLKFISDDSNWETMPRIVSPEAYRAIFARLGDLDAESRTTSCMTQLAACMNDFGLKPAKEVPQNAQTFRTDLTRTATKIAGVHSSEDYRFLYQAGLIDDPKTPIEQAAQNFLTLLKGVNNPLSQNDILGYLGRPVSRKDRRYFVGVANLLAEKEHEEIKNPSKMIALSVSTFMSLLTFIDAETQTQDSKGTHAGILLGYLSQRGLRGAYGGLETRSNVPASVPYSRVLQVANSISQSLKPSPRQLNVQSIEDLPAAIDRLLHVATCFGESADVIAADSELQGVIADVHAVIDETVKRSTRHKLGVAASVITHEDAVMVLHAYLPLEAAAIALERLEQGLDIVPKKVRGAPRDRLMRAQRILQQPRDAHE